MDNNIQIVKRNGHLASCGCEPSLIQNTFEIFTHPKVANCPVAFCVHCGKGKFLVEWQNDSELGVWEKSEFIEEHGL